VIGKLNAVATYFSWLFLAGMVATFVLGFFEIKLEMKAYYLIYGGFFSFALIHFVLAFWVRCPYCNKCLTIQGFDRPHSESIHKSWSPVVLYWFTGRVGCIHCGQTVSTSDL